MGIESNVPIELQETVKDVVGRKNKLVYMSMVQLEVKADRPENRVLALSEHKLYVLLPRVPARLDHSVAFLDLQAIESRSTLQMVLTTENKRLVFSAVQGDSVLFNRVITHIGVSLTTVFPSVPLDKLIHKISVSPTDRLSMMQEKVKAIKKKDQGPCGGFSVAYRFMCLYHALPYMEDVAWDVDTIYLSHNTKELNLGDFDHLDARHLIPIISACEHNTWFTKFNASNIKLSPEATTELLKVMRKNTTFEELQLSNIGARWDFANKLAQALMSNANSPLATIDLSYNFIEDKGLYSISDPLSLLLVPKPLGAHYKAQAQQAQQGLNHLCGPMSQLSHGLVSLNLAKTGVTARGVNRLAEALAANKFVSSTLKHLDLSENQFKGEEVAAPSDVYSKNLYNFLAHPNAITRLRLSGNDCALEMIFGALLRGCCQTLTHLDLSRNMYSTRRTKDKDVQVPSTWQKFFANCMALQSLNLSECRLPPEAIKNVLLGIGANPNTRNVELNLCSNNLGNAGTDFIDACFSNLNNITALDISDNGLDMLVKMVVEQLTGNKCLKKLSLGKNFSGIRPRYLPGVLEAIVEMIQEEECALQSLSLIDSKLKLESTTIINSLGGNTSLTEIDISGNQMGDTGARMLAKALQINTKLRAVLWDRNGTSTQGFVDIAAAMEKNFMLKTMPTPVHDASLALKLDPEKASQALARIEALLQRNHSPRKFASDQGYRLQQGFLISSTEQMVDKNIVQLQDVINKLEQGVVSQAMKDDIVKANLVIKEADKSAQILPKLQEVALKSEEEGGSIDKQIQLLSTQLQFVLDAQLRNNVKQMMTCVEDQCPTVLGEKDLKEEMKTACTEKGALPKTFCESLLRDQVGSDVFNKVSELNLSVASHMTDSLLDGILESLERTYKVLSRHLKARNRDSSEFDFKTDKDQSHLVRKKDTFAPPESPGPLPKIGNKRETVYSRRLRPQSVIDPADVEKARRMMAQQALVEESLVEAHSEPSLNKKAEPKAEPKASSSREARHLPSSLSQDTKSAAPSGVDTKAALTAPVATSREKEKDNGTDNAPVPAPRLSRRKRTSIESHKVLETDKPTEKPAAQKHDLEKESEKRPVAKPEEETKSKKHGGDTDEEIEEDARSKGSSEGLDRDTDKDPDSRSIDTIDSVSTVDSSLDSREGTPTSEKAPSKISGAKGAKKSATTTLDLPSLALDTEAPKLEHLGKARPKRPKTKAISRPVIRAEDILIEEAELVDHGVDSFFENKPVAKEAVTPVGASHSEEKLNKQNSLDEKVTKEDAGSAKKKGWSPFSGGEGGKGFGNLFRKSPKSPKAHHDSSKKGEGDKTTPPTRKSPEIELEKDDSGGFKSEPEKEEAEEEIKPTPRKTRGIGLPGMGMGMPGGGGGALLAEMKAKTGKRETVKPTAPPPPKKVEEDKPRSTKESSPAHTGSKPPAGGAALQPPTGGSTKVSPSGGAPMRPASMLTPRELTKPTPVHRASSPAAADDNASNGPTARTRPPMRPKPPPVAPKPKDRASTLTSPTPAPRQSNPPPRPSGPPQRRLSVREYLKRFQDMPEEKPKGSSTDSGLDSRSEQQRKRSSVKQKAALLDKNSNETSSDLPQRSSGPRLSKPDKEEEKPSDADKDKDKSEDGSRSSPDMQLNGSAPKTPETTQEIYL